jgi:hypothetical protein
MAGVYGEIDNRADFDALLNKATSDGKQLLAKRPGDQTIEVIIRQLEAVATWCAGGRTPSEDERESIDIAVRASREFEGDSETYTWTRALSALDAYIEDWPSDDKAASATDDDFFDSDD